MDIVSALASLVRVTETGSFPLWPERDVGNAAVARQRPQAQPDRCAALVAAIVASGEIE
jgi:hypothetical protein